MSKELDIGGAPSLEKPQTDAQASSALPSPVSRRVAKRQRDGRVRRMKREVTKEATHLADNRKFRYSIETFTETTILLRESFAELRSKGLIDENGELRSSIDTFTRLAALQLKYANALGLTPVSLGKFKATKPDLAAAFAEVEDAEQA